MDTISTWSPGFCLRFRPEKDNNYALLVLNRPILENEHFTQQVWKHAKLRICADGGANRLFDHLGDSDRGVYLPDCITGDLDSIKPEVQSFYEARDVPVVEDKDQYATDFTKSIRWISNNETAAMLSQSQQKLDVIALGGFGGRVDQAFACVQELHVNASHRRIFLLSEESVTFLLSPGKNVIETPMELFGPTCGIIPVGQPAVISTAGLEWDLHETETRFGGMVSTSNHIARDAVEVVTDVPVLFTAEIRRAET